MKANISNPYKQFNRVSESDYYERVNKRVNYLSKLILKKALKEHKKISHVEIIDNLNFKGINIYK